MMKYIALALIAASIAVNVMAEIKSSGTCPGGKQNGEQFNEGRYWYECQNGQIVPKGCLDDNNNRVPIDGTYDTKQYRMQCIKGSDGFLTVIYKACMQNGEHDVGSQWDDGTAYFTCVQQGNNVRVITLGCVDQGKPMKLDDRVAKGDFVYKCAKSTDGTPRINKVGCIFEGKKYMIGETFEGPKFWYTCTDSGSKIVGCMYNGHRLQSGDHFTLNDMMFTCTVKLDDAVLEPFACMAREANGAAVERKVGCSWVEGEYEYTCKSENNQVAKVKSQCVYNGSEGKVKLLPGCAQMVSTIAVGCVDNGNGNLQLRTASRIDGMPGLRQC
jgi:hypothetical protein